jgi:flagellar motor protein MotB
MDLDDGDLGEESVGWPSYVDFLTSFIFILILIVGALLYLLSGNIEQVSFEAAMQQTIKEINAAGYDARIDGKRLIIMLKGKVSFSTGEPETLDGYRLSKENEDHLREIGKSLVSKKNCPRIVIQGYADNDPYRNDPFGNWLLSVRRATAVLKYFYECTDCGYPVDEIRKKLKLSGEGDLASGAFDKSRDRSVELILDYGKSEQAK